MIRVTHNVYASPGSVDIIRFAAASPHTPKISKGADMMVLEVWCGPNCLVERAFDGSNPDAFHAAQQRMAELVGQVERFDAALTERP